MLRETRELLAMSETSIFQRAHTESLYNDLMRGFEEAGFICAQAPTSAVNPVQIEWHLASGIRRYRLCAFDITHGGPAT
jgi:hypothetical protein